jgi:hypothetical protein
MRCAVDGWLQRRGRWAIWLIVAAGGLGLGGCAEEHYVKPAPVPQVKSPAIATVRKPGVVNEGTEAYLRVERPLASAWKDYLAQIRQKNLSVETADEASHSVVLRYKGDPSPYVDCGKVVSAVRTDSGEKNYDFPAAQAYMQYEIMNQNKLYRVERRMRLDAVLHVIFEPLSATMTKVSAQSIYTLTRDQAATTDNEPPIALTDAISFKTGEIGIFPNAATKCRPIGTLEAAALPTFR